MRTERKQVLATKRGRPCELPGKARSKRVVAFVTERGLECLERDRVSISSAAMLDPAPHLIARTGGRY